MFSNYVDFLQHKKNPKLVTNKKRKFSLYLYYNSNWRSDWQRTACVEYTEKMYSSYCGLSLAKMVVYMPQISTHKHYSLEGSARDSQRLLPTDYAMIYLVWNNCENVAMTSC